MEFDQNGTFVGSPLADDSFGLRLALRVRA